MNNIIYTVLYAFILVSSLLYIWHRLLNRKINFKSIKLYISLFGIMAVSIFNFFGTDKFIRIIFITVIFMLFFRYLFKEDLKKCIITPIYYQIIIMISETLYALIITFVFKSDAEFLINTYLGTFMTNVCIAIISLLISELKFIKKIYNIILNLTNKIKERQLEIMCFIIIVALSVFPMTIYYNVKFQYLLIFYSSMVIACCVIVFYLLKTQNKYNKVSDKYNVVITSLNNYEEMITKYRVANHENKNLLLTVRAMVLNKEENIPKYIDSIIKEKYDDNEKLLFKMSVIPTGGLRATIYSSILKLQSNKINYDLQIDSKIKTIDLINLDTDTIIDVCKILGVFIDNAIEEVLTLKDRNVQICIYLENNILNIKVSNKYKNKIQINKIFDEGYTTKGNGHGYGLALVKKLIDKNKLFANYTEITKDIFSQILSIEYKK